LVWYQNSIGGKRRCSTWCMRFRIFHLWT
jgi:hypothetical protein